MRLTAKERDALALYHLGGVEAWHTETARVYPKTIDSLVRKGLLDRNGTTPTGKVIAAQCADAAHAATQN